MKRIAWLLVAVLISAISLYAQDTVKAHAMTGWLCNSKCVTQSLSDHPKPANEYHLKTGQRE